MPKRRFSSIVDWNPWVKRGIKTWVNAQASAGANRLRSTPRPSSLAALPRGEWISGVAVAPGGMRRYRLYRPPGVLFSDRLPLLVMLHGCRQDANDFAVSTRMNTLAARHRFFVLYPEQDRRVHPQACWNWYDTRSGLAFAEAAIVMAALDQVCLLYPVDASRVALAGLSAGASLAGLLAVQHPARFKSVAMHSGVPPGAAHSTASALAAMRGHRSDPGALPVPTGEAPWPPLMVIHGRLDSVVSLDNAHCAARLWAQATGAQATPARRLQRGRRHAMQVTDFVRGRRVMVALREVETLGHAWSGGAARQAHSDARGPDASKLIWAFIAKHFGRAIGDSRLAQS